MYKTIKAQTAKLIEIRTEKETLHNSFVNKTQNFHGELGTLFLLRGKLKNLWHAWKNVTRWQKAARKASETQKDTVCVYLTRLALKKMYNRMKITVKCRAASEKLKEKIRIIMLQAVFNGLKNRYDVENSLAVKLGNIAAKFDNRMKEAALQSISEHADRNIRLKDQVKGIAASNLAGVLNQLYLSRMRTNLSDLRSKILKMWARRATIKNMLGHLFSWNLRDMFQKWKYQSLKQSTVEEVNEEGPVVEEVLVEQMRYENLKNFLKDQRYTSTEVS